MFIPYHDDNPTRRFPYVTVAVIVLNVLAAAPFGFYIPLIEGKAPTHEMRVLWTTFGFVPQELTNLNSGEPVHVELYSDLEPNVVPVADSNLTIQPSAGMVGMSLRSEERRVGKECTGGRCT